MHGKCVLFFRAKTRKDNRYVTRLAASARIGFKSPIGTEPNEPGV